VVASVLAGADFKPVQAFLALFVSLSLQVAVNYSNDYSDGIRGTDDNRIGPIRLTASGLAPAESVKCAAILS
jgi:1,4-dihydroxy-2-naphthoate octaprenyltransferase